MWSCFLFLYSESNLVIELFWEKVTSTLLGLTPITCKRILDWLHKIPKNDMSRFPSKGRIKNEGLIEKRIRRGYTEFNKLKLSVKLFERIRWEHPSLKNDSNAFIERSHSRREQPCVKEGEQPGLQKNQQLNMKRVVLLPKKCKHKASRSLKTLSEPFARLRHCTKNPLRTQEKSVL